MKSELSHRYSGRGSAVELRFSRAPEVLLSGPAGTGKSRACLEKIHELLLRQPGTQALIVRKAMSTLSTTGLVTYRKYVAAEAITAGHVSFYGGSARDPAQYTYSNGSALIIGGMDKATKIMSSEYDLAYVQEAIELTENDWESITTRLRAHALPFTQLIADTNPSTPTHWLKKRVDRGLTLMLQSKHEENPTLFDDAGNVTEHGKSYIARLDALTGVRYYIYRKGLWVAAEGLIYSELDPERHFIDDFPIPDDWPRYWSIDWGFTNPTVIQFWAEDHDGRMYLYREMYMSNKTVDQHATELMDFIAPKHAILNTRIWIEPKPVRILADHNAGDRAQFTKITRLQTTAANKKVDLGIQAVQRRLRMGADGKPRLFIMRGALFKQDQVLVDAKKPTCTMEELPGYVWDTMAGKDRDLKETPKKENDHGCDALRYYIAHRDLTGTSNVRFV